MDVIVEIEGNLMTVRRGQAAVDLPGGRRALLSWGETCPETYIGHHIEEPTAQMKCAHSIPNRVFEAARVCAFAFPTAAIEHVAERVASYYGYDEAEARRVFVGAVTHYLERNRA